MFDGDKLIVNVLLSCKKSFSMGVVIQHKMRNCNKCSKDILCDGCDDLVNQNKEFSANLNQLKRQARNENGYMLPSYETKKSDNYIVRYLNVEMYLQQTKNQHYLYSMINDVT